MPRGSQEYFFDGPFRRVWANSNQKWTAELSLVAKDKTGTIKSLITFTYKFTLSSTGQYSIQRLGQTNPSSFHNTAIMSAK